MRYLILSILIITTSCGSNKIIRNYRYPNNNKMEKLDVNAFSKANNEITKKYKRMVSKQGSGGAVSRIEEICLETNVILLISVGVNKDGTYTNFQKRVINPSKPFIVKTIFYPSGEIFAKGNYYTGMPYEYSSGYFKRPYEFEEGIWEFYNKQGKVIKTINYDSFFEFDLNDVLNFMKLNGFDKIPGNLPIGRYINEEAGFGNWNILVQNNEGRFNILLDGKTGEVISKQQFQIHF